jgi:hypothetical protein
METALETTLFDASVGNTIEFTVARRGQRFTVKHHFKAYDDEEFIQYEIACARKLTEADAEETAVARSFRLTSEALRAGKQFWERLIIEIIGYVASPDWRALTLLRFTQDCLFALDNYFGVQIVPLPAAPTHEALSYVAEDEAEHHLLAPFYGQTVVTKHFLRQPSAEDFERYENLRGASVAIGGTRYGREERLIPSRARAKGKLYGELLIRTEGYQGLPPLHHQVAIIDAHFAPQQELILGESAAPSSMPSASA